MILFLFKMTFTIFCVSLMVMAYALYAAAIIGVTLLLLQPSWFLTNLPLIVCGVLVLCWFAMVIGVSPWLGRFLEICGEAIKYTWTEADVHQV